MADKKKLLVVIDPGHTGTAYNAGAVKNYYESQAMYDLSVYEKTALEAYGIDVILTRSLHENPELYDRGQMAVRKGADYECVLFESNHSNAANGQACGVVLFRSVSLPKSEELGHKLVEAIVSVMSPATGITYNRGVVTKVQSDGRDWYGVIRGAVSGAASESQTGNVRYAYIIEHGFHDNRKECEFLFQQKNLKMIAEAKAKVIAEYFNIKNQDNQPGIADGLHNPSSEDGEKKTPYLVKVEIDDLNIRTKPTIYSESVGYTDAGVFTIVEEADGVASRTGKISRWGRLKSKRGWICLDYAKAV